MVEEIKMGGESGGLMEGLIKSWLGPEAAETVAPYICWSVALACIIPNIGGLLGGLFLKNSLRTWYQELKKAPWNPPDWVFGPVWTCLYTSMGFASYLVWRDGGGFTERTIVPLGLFALQLLVNWAWTPMFFGYRSIKWSLVDIIVLDVLVAACAVYFSKINKTAGAIFIPYMLWLCLATTLSIYIYTRNPEKHHPKHHKKSN